MLDQKEEYTDKKEETSILINKITVIVLMMTIYLKINIGLLVPETDDITNKEINLLPHLSRKISFKKTKKDFLDCLQTVIV